MISIDIEKCVVCGGCIDLCPSIAIRMVHDTVAVSYTHLTLPTN